LLLSKQGWYNYPTGKTILEEHYPVDFVYFNGGLHLLHLTPCCWKEKKTEREERVMSLESILEDFLSTMKGFFQR
jgi:hypothetical protein